ncbi:MAG TPA: histidine kinase dimerization/phosphoacceptor domain -containing protein [Burkholderiaceae bacterium]|nr:histidine kinase dimerization/phosphoacceptor domain -containing protein [Burkholderiaceae bacterium]
MTPSFPLRPRYRRAELLPLLAVVGVWAAVIRACIAYFSVDGFVSVVYPTIALSLALVLSGRSHWWPAVFLGEYLGNLWTGLDWRVAVPISALDTAEPLLAGWLLLRHAGFDPHLRRMRDFLSLIAVTTATAVGAALIGPTVLWWSGVTTAPQTYAGSLLAWFQGEWTVMLFLAPVLLVWRQWPAGWWTAPGRRLEALACFGGALACGYVVFGGVVPSEGQGPDLEYLPFFFAAWAAVRFGRHGASLLVVATAAQALLGAVDGEGLFATELARHSLLDFWLYMTVLAGVGMALALVIEERSAAAEALHHSEQRLRFLLGATPVVLYTARVDGDYGATYISDNLERVLGHTAEEFLRDPGFWATHLHPDDAPRVLGGLGPLFEHGHHSHQYRFQHRDGSWRWMHDEIALVRDEQGRPVEMVGCWLDIDARARAEEQLRTALREKDVLLKEVYHRVKNNLQVVSSLLQLQQRTSPAPAREVLAESANRIKSMALVHEQLYRSEDLSSIDFTAYLEQLVEHLQQAAGDVARRAPVRLDVVALSLGVETAIPLGLVVNELIGNAYKHAFPDARRGSVSVSLRRTEAGSATIVVRDDGVGVPAGFDPAASPSLGMQLVVSLTEQLEGSLRFERGDDGGTCVSLRFALPVKGAAA